MALMNPLDAVERAIRSGELDTARHTLNRLNREGAWSRFPAAQLANLLWRIGEAGRGQRVLARSLGELSAAALEQKPEEAAEYAACLLRLGAYAEAHWILRLPAVTRV